MQNHLAPLPASPWFLLFYPNSPRPRVPPAFSTSTTPAGQTASLQMALSSCGQRARCCVSILHLSWTFSLSCPLNSRAPSSPLPRPVPLTLSRWPHLLPHRRRRGHHTHCPFSSPGGPPLPGSPGWPTLSIPSVKHTDCQERQGGHSFRAQNLRGHQRAQ